MTISAKNVLDKEGCFVVQIVRDFTLISNPVYGNCYVFNSGWNKSQPLKHASHSGRTHGLSTPSAKHRPG